VIHAAKGRGIQSKIYQQQGQILVSADIRKSRDLTRVIQGTVPVSGPLAASIYFTIRGMMLP